MKHSHEHKDYYKAPKDLEKLVTDAVIKAQDETADEVFERWKSYIGVENCDHDPITEEGLREWSRNPHREFQCIFCSDAFTIEEMATKNGVDRNGKVNIGCPRCRDYKGTIPYIVNPKKGHV